MKQYSQDEALAGLFPLKPKQIGHCLDAGYTMEELATKGQPWYDSNKESLTYHGQNADAFPTQLAYLKTRIRGFDATHIKKYCYARKLIQHLAKLDNDNPEYLQYIACAEALWAKKAKKKTKPDFELLETLIPDIPTTSDEDDRTPASTIDEIEEAIRNGPFKNEKNVKDDDNDAYFINLARNGNTKKSIL